MQNRCADGDLELAGYPDACRLDDLLQGVAADPVAAGAHFLVEPGGPLDEAGANPLGDERSDTVHLVDDPVQRELVKGLADDRPADAIVLTQLGFTGEPWPGDHSSSTLLTRIARS